MLLSGHSICRYCGTFKAIAVLIVFVSLIRIRALDKYLVGKQLFVLGGCGLFGAKAQSVFEIRRQSIEANFLRRSRP